MSVIFLVWSLFSRSLRRTSPTLKSDSAVPSVLPDLGTTSPYGSSLAPPLLPFAVLNCVKFCLLKYSVWGSLACFRLWDEACILDYEVAIMWVRENGPIKLVMVCLVLGAWRKVSKLVEKKTCTYRSIFPRRSPSRSPSRSTSRARTRASS